jgi:hypothetical protein
MQNPKIKLYHQHIVTQRGSNGLITMMKNTTHFGFKEVATQDKQKPHTFLSSRNCWRSFKYIENKKGERFSPCRTPILHGKYSDISHNLFVIYMLISIMKNKKKKLYCAFIDFAKAFDTVWRKGLWHKLLGNEINGKLGNSLQKTYLILYSKEM